MATVATSIAAHVLDAVLPGDAHQRAQFAKRASHLEPIGKPRARPFREVAPQQLILPPQAAQSCPCSPLLWANHASLPSSPLMLWGPVSPELYSTPATPFNRVTSPLQLRPKHSTDAATPSFESALQACQEEDSFFSSGEMRNPPLSPSADVTLPRSPADQPSEASSTGPMENEDEADDAEGKELNGRVLEGNRCPHRKSWKRLRAKKGCAFFVCFQCGAKWRTKSGEAGSPEP